VFLHPASILFTNASWRSPFITYFGKHKTSKVFLRDATEVRVLTSLRFSRAKRGQQIPIYALLLFGGPVTVNHVAGGLTISSKGGSAIKLKAWPRIGVLVNQLR
jgi:ATP-dependent RNA helicase DHX57